MKDIENMPDNLHNLVGEDEFADAEGTEDVVPGAPELSDKQDLPPVKGETFKEDTPQSAEESALEEAHHGDKRLSIISKFLDNLGGGSKAPFSIPFQRAGKTYDGFIVSLDGAYSYLRFEFEGQYLRSISVWGNLLLDDTPNFIIQVQGNLYDDSVFQTIKDALDSYRESIPTSKTRARILESAKEIIEVFLEENPDDGGSLSAMYRKYMKWAQENGEKIYSDITFSETLKRLRKSAVGATKETGVKVQPGVPDDALPEYDEFEKKVLKSRVIYTYEMMAEVTKKILTWDPNFWNAFIYGTGGVGKSYTIKKSIEKWGKPEEVVIKTGAISGFTGLLQLLWEHRTRKIIVLDDNDTILDKPAGINILKGAMNNEDPRIISYTRMKSAGDFSVAEAGIHMDLSSLEENLVSVYVDGKKVVEDQVTDSERRWYESISGGSFRTENRDYLYEGVEFDDPEVDASFVKGDLDPETDPAYGMGPNNPVPDDFQFTSRVIFLSNKLHVPQPLLDRCVLVGLILDKREILILVEKLLNDLAPNIPMEAKRATLSFLRKYSHRVQVQLTFRMFATAAAIMASDIPNAKEQIYNMMTAQGAKPLLK